jgi:hypothetical protein
MEEPFNRGNIAKEKSTNTEYEIQNTKNVKFEIGGIFDADKRG